MKKKSFLKPFLIFILIGYLSVGNTFAFQQVFNCSPNPSPDDRNSANECLLDALANAKPGDEIILEPGIYIGGIRSEMPFDNFSSFTSSASGTPNNPIILRGSSPTNKPIITTKGNREHSWYGLAITGDYWIIKDIIVTNVAKGVMLDDANHCQLINLEVYDIGEEAIHLRSGSSNNLIKNCKISYTGQAEGKQGFGEGIYVGSDRAKHADQSGDLHYPDCNNNIIEFCEIGPHISAEAFDIKEGTENTVVRNCTFYANGITGANSGDSFIDLKGIYGYVYDNVFNVNPNNDSDNDVSKLNSIIDISNRTFGSYDYKTGQFSAIFDNQLYIANNKSDIPTARIILDPEKQPSPSENVHVWNNERIPNSQWVLDDTSENVIDQFCPDWNQYRTCENLSIDTPSTEASFTIIQSPGTRKISIIGLSSASSNISIFDINGKIVKNKITSNQIETMNMHDIHSGVYILQVKTKTSRSAKMFAL